MLKLFFTISDLYRRLPKNITDFKIKQIGRKFYLYACCSLGRKSLVGRYDTYAQAAECILKIKNIQKNCENQSGNAFASMQKVKSK